MVVMHRKCPELLRFHNLDVSLNLLKLMNFLFLACCVWFFTSETMQGKVQKTSEEREHRARERPAGPAVP